MISPWAPVLRSKIWLPVVLMISKYRIPVVMTS
jgi:hypothetical protein